jgi:hypothetical protein
MDDSSATTDRLAAHVICSVLKRSQAGRGSGRFCGGLPLLPFQYSFARMLTVPAATLSAPGDRVIDAAIAEAKRVA